MPLKANEWREKLMFSSCAFLFLAFYSLTMCYTERGYCVHSFRLLLLARHFVLLLLFSLFCYSVTNKNRELCSQIQHNLQAYHNSFCTQAFLRARNNAFDRIGSSSASGQTYQNSGFFLSSVLLAFSSVFSIFSHQLLSIFSIHLLLSLEQGSTYTHSYSHSTTRAALGSLIPCLALLLPSRSAGVS